MKKDVAKRHSLQVHHYTSTSKPSHTSSITLPLYSLHRELELIQEVIINARTIAPTQPPIAKLLNRIWNWARRGKFDVSKLSFKDKQDIWKLSEQVRKNICSRCKFDIEICGCERTHPSDKDTTVQSLPNLDDYDITDDGSWEGR